MDRRTYFGLALTAFFLGSLVSGTALLALGGQSGGRRPVERRGSLLPEERTTIDLFRKAAPSVVFITSLSVRRDVFSFDVQKIPRGNGSGFVWDARGHVVTNYHVIRGANAARVTLSDQSTWDAQLIGFAEEKDLAVLRIDAPAERLKPIAIGSSEDLVVGQKVIAIGNPFGLDHTLTTGVISALGREIESMAQVPIRDVIQTDAAINPGNSGGPLLDSAGRLIGVNAAIYSPSGAYAGIGFAIPIDTVNWVVSDLIAHGRVVRPTLGVQIATPQLAQQLRVKGALVISVMPGSGAERAGLRPTRRDAYGRLLLGDVIVRAGAEKVTDSGDLLLALESFQGGDKVPLTIQRDGKQVVVEVTVDTGR